MYMVRSKDNRFESWGIDSLDVAVLGARRDADRFGGTVIISKDGVDAYELVG